MSVAKANGLSITTLVAVCTFVCGVAGSIMYFYVMGVTNPLRERISRLEVQQVPRVEHEKDAIYQRDRDSRQDGRIDEIRRDFGNTYSIRDMIQDMNDRLKRIETGAKK